MMGEDEQNRHPFGEGQKTAPLFPSQIEQALHLQSIFLLHRQAHRRQQSTLNVASELPMKRMEE
jgi:hypothetical protein